MYILGIDLGTTGCKSILFSKLGKIIAESYIEYPLIYTKEGYIEQDADLWWSLVKKVIRDTVKSSEVAPNEIAALSVSSQGIAFVAVDKEGKTLCNAISWLDTRATAQSDFLQENFGDKTIFERTGKRISPNYSLSKIMWLKENRQDIYRRTWKFLMGLDFLTYKLTGEIVTDHSMASGTMAYNLRDKAWDLEILRGCGIDREKFPKISYLGTIVGNVLQDIAREIGLSAETLVILGAQDQKCSVIGSGIKEGICAVSLGTATAITTIGNEPMIDPDMRIPCFALDEGRWVLEAVITTAGVSLKWMKNIIFADKSYDEMNEIVETVPAGSGDVWFYPHLEGAASPFWKPDAKGFIYGIGLTTSSGEILRALYEGIAYQIRSNIEVLEQLNTQINEIHIFGGGSKSSIWCKIIADIIGKNVCVLYTSETANLGAAIIAGTGSGVYRDYSDIIENVKLIEKTYKPDAKLLDLYDAAYEKYLEIQKKILN